MSYAEDQLATQAAQLGVPAEGLHRAFWTTRDIVKGGLAEPDNKALRIVQHLLVMGWVPPQHTAAEVANERLAKLQGAIDTAKSGGAA